MRRSEVLLEHAQVAYADKCSIFRCDFHALDCSIPSDLRRLA